MGMASIHGRQPHGALTGRTAIGLRFDRNCILAGVAGRLLVALAIGASVEAIVVGETAFLVGPVAHDIEATPPPGDGPGVLTVNAGGALGFGYASGVSYAALTEGLSPEQLATFDIANAIVAHAIADRSMLYVVRRLDRLTIPGNHRSLEWLKSVSKASQN